MKNLVALGLPIGLTLFYFAITTPDATFRQVERFVTILCVLFAVSAVPAVASPRHLKRVLLIIGFVATATITVRYLMAVRSPGAEVAHWVLLLAGPSMIASSLSIRPETQRVLALVRWALAGLIVISSVAVLVGDTRTGAAFGLMLLSPLICIILYALFRHNPLLYNAGNTIWFQHPEHHRTPAPVS